jgi:hypothetical protein
MLISVVVIKLDGGFGAQGVLRPLRSDGELVEVSEFMIIILEIIFFNSLVSQRLRGESTFLG